MKVLKDFLQYFPIRYSQVAFSILAVFLVQYFLFLNMGHKASYKRFAPYMYIVIFAAGLWSAIFYSVGYSFL